MSILFANGLIDALVDSIEDGVAVGGNSFALEEEVLDEFVHGYALIVLR